MSIAKSGRAAGLYWEERGSGPETIVWLPGFGCSIRAFDEIVPAFDDHRSILVDLPGHAESAAVSIEPDLPGFGAAIFAAIEELELDRVTLIGYSMGGAIGVRIALDHPERVAGVIGILPWQAKGAAEVDENLDGFAALHGDAEAIAAGAEGLAVVDPAASRQLATDMLTVTKETWEGWLLKGSRISQADELPRISVPVDYILGAADEVVDLGAAIEDVAAIPGARAVVLSGVGHLGPAEHPAEMVRETRMALERQSR
jgi:3-oxoadipate enol-lactonase